MSIEYNSFIHSFIYSLSSLRVKTVGVSAVKEQLQGHFSEQVTSLLQGHKANNTHARALPYLHVFVL